MSTKTKELQSQISLAKNYIKTKQYDRAEDILLKILKVHKLADVYNSLGLLYADLGKFNFAEIAFKNALKINPQYMEAALNLSVVYNNLGLGKKSKEIYQKLKAYGAKSRGAMDPMLMAKIANMHAEIGDLYHSVGEYKLAIGEYEQAVDLCPQFIDVQTKLATSYRETGKKTQALKIFNKVKKSASRYAPFWIALGVTYYSQNKRKDALKSWQKALLIEPGNKVAQAYCKLVA
ncbi:MAG: tetratricopeptide repeat protein [Deltaproteobacteria bacterium]|nr:tetratricopeptide repeat protein [Deltaproteobacteria bacterium]